MSLVNLRTDLFNGFNKFIIYPLTNQLYQQRSAGNNMHIETCRERKQCHDIKRNNSIKVIIYILQLLFLTMFSKVQLNLVITLCVFDLFQ